MDMTEIEQLPPDQRAALSLLLRRRKRYEEVAKTLAIAPSAVHDRAHAALAALVPEQASSLDAATRERVGEYLLGQQDGAEEAATRALLAGSEPARAWAQALAGGLAKLAPEALPEIPDSTHAAASQPPISRRGGAILLAGIVAVAAVVVALVLSLGGQGGSGGANQAASRSSGTGAGQSSGSKVGGGSNGGGEPRIEKVAQLKPLAGGSAKGAAAIASEGGRRALVLNALDLPPTNGFSYVVWLIGTHGQTTPFGRTPAVGKDGRIRAVELLTAEPSAVSGVEITRETSVHPSAPGTVVLKGSFVSR
jgi:hypothetical protein